MLDIILRQSLWQILIVTQQFVKFTSYTVKQL